MSFMRLMHIKYIKYIKTPHQKSVQPVFTTAPLFCIYCHRHWMLNTGVMVKWCRMNRYLLGVDELHTLQPGGEEGLWAQDTLAPLRQHVLQLWVHWQSSGHHWEPVCALLEDESRWEFLNTLNYNQHPYGKVMVKTNNFYFIYWFSEGEKRYQGYYS